jgi:hypothetical protein
MMKLTRHVFSWSPRPEHMDYYERLMFNHRLGTIDPVTGITVYFVPVGGGYSKIFAKPFDSFWCCSGSGAEEFAKLTDTIYFHDDNSIFVNLYIASIVDWPKKRNSPEPADIVSRRTGNHTGGFSSETGRGGFEIAHSVLGEKWERESEWTRAASFRRPRQLPCSTRAVEERGPH